MQEQETLFACSQSVLPLDPDSVSDASFEKDDYPNGEDWLLVERSICSHSDTMQVQGVSSNQHPLHDREASSDVESSLVEGPLNERGKCLLSSWVIQSHRNVAELRDRLMQARVDLETEHEKQLLHCEFVEEAAKSVRRVLLDHGPTGSGDIATAAETITAEIESLQRQSMSLKTAERKCHALEYEIAGSEASFVSTLDVLLERLAKDPRLSCIILKHGEAQFSSTSADSVRRPKKSEACLSVPSLDTAWATTAWSLWGQSCETKADV